MRCSHKWALKFDDLLHQLRLNNRASEVKFFMNCNSLFNVNTRFKVTLKSFYRK